MRKLFMSDLHLGSPLFKKEYQITQLFNCSNYKEIYILGDIIDTWEDDLDNIVKQYRNLIRIINNSPAKVFIIKGNHDPSIDRLKFIFHSCEVVNKIEMNLPNKKIIMVHGDEFDDAVTKYSWAAKALFPLHWLLEKLGVNVKGYLRELFHSIAMKKDNKHYNDIITEIERRAVKKYKDYSIILMGHTHLAKMVYSSTPVYLNTGSMLMDASCIEYYNDEFTKREL